MEISIDVMMRQSRTLFLWFLQNNGILYRQDGTKRITDPEEYDYLR